MITLSGTYCRDSQPRFQGTLGFHRNPRNPMSPRIPWSSFRESTEFKKFKFVFMFSPMFVNFPKKTVVMGHLAIMYYW